MIETRTRSEIVPGVHSDIEFLDLLPAAASGRGTSDARHVTQVNQPRRVDLAQ